MGFRVLELFSGIGGMHYAFKCEFSEKLISKKENLNIPPQMRNWMEK